MWRGIWIQTRCSRCKKPIKEVGRLQRIVWLGFRAPLCKSCRAKIRKDTKNKFTTTIKSWLK